MQQLKIPVYILVAFMVIMSVMSMWIKFEGTTEEPDVTILRTWYMSLGLAMLYLVILGWYLWSGQKPYGTIMQRQAYMGIGLAVMTIWMLWYGRDTPGGEVTEGNEVFDFFYAFIQGVVLFGTAFNVYKLTQAGKMGGNSQGY